MVTEQEDTSFSFTHKGEKYSGRFRTLGEATDLDFWIWFSPAASTKEDFRIIRVGNDPGDAGKWQEVIDPIEGELIPGLDQDIIQTIGEAIESLQE